MSEVAKLYAAHRVRHLVVLGLLLAGLLLAVAIAIRIGAVPIPAGTVLRITLSRLWPGAADGWPPSYEAIVLEVRWPRVVLGMLVRGALSLSGCVMQGLFRNPMASPYTLGLASGAAFGAALAIVLGLPGFALPATAFIFALGTVFLVWRLAGRRGGVRMETLLLSGLAVGAFFSALVSLMLYLAGEKLADIVFWLMGGLWASDWQDVLISSPFILGGMAGTLFFVRELDLLLLGDEQARSLGVEAGRVKALLLALVSLVTAAAVCVSGVIGFVGLIVPHLMRVLLGPGHRLLLPASALAGAILLLGTDTLARSVVAPSELPVGIITAVLGAPFFLWLLRRRVARRPDAL